MASTVYFLSLLLLTCSTFMPSKSHSISSTNDGFSISIIHRDSPFSPSYNPSITPYETHIAQLRRSFSRIEHFSMRASANAITHPQTQQSNKPPEKTRIFYNSQSQQYIASYFIGYPNGQLVRAFVDTGSEITWTNINTPNGYKPSKSVTYSKLLCRDSLCQGLGNHRKTCTDGSKPCTYTQEYGGGRIITSGVLSKDIFSFDYQGNGSSPGQEGFFLNFGCNNGVRIINSSSVEFYGILGLDRGPLSFISQLRIKRFSHCLVGPEKRSPSTMHFGSNAVINPKGFTPFVQSAPSTLLSYYVSLQGIGIGSTKVPIPQGTFDVTPDGGGGFVVDCGTPYTLLTEKAYDPFLNLMRSRFLPKHLVLYRDRDHDCFKGTQKDLDGVPPVTFHFDRGVDVKLAKERIFVNVGEAWCLAIAKSFVGRVSLFGSYQMANINVVFDLEKNGVSFTQADCSASTSGGA